jgi:hypothetical protein
MKTRSSVLLAVLTLAACATPAPTRRTEVVGPRDPTRVGSAELQTTTRIRVAEDVNETAKGKTYLALPPGVNLVYGSEKGVMLWQSGSAPRLLCGGENAIGQVRWSPNGTSVVGIMSPGKVVVIDVGTGNLRELTDGKNADSAPSWSPDGSRIALIRDMSKGKTDLFVVDVNGANLTRCTNPTSTWGG